MDTTSPQTVNVLLTSFRGLGLPPTLSIPVLATESISDVVATISKQLPTTNARFILTTTSNKQLSSQSTSPITVLLDSTHDTFLPLRLSAPICGGKGGFGSQLRAAGGRMSSRKKKNKEESTGSYRTLDGRRVRVVNQARKLAEQLEIRPEMEKKEKEERRAKWEQIVETSDKKIEELKHGGKTRLDGKWVENYEEAMRKTREAVVASMQESDASTSESADSEGSESEEAGASGSGSGSSEKRETKSVAPVTFFGWDEDELSEDSEEDGEDKEDDAPATDEKDKGKAKA
jgi:Silencing defective 2 N-terminal ubiquitin domain